MYGMYLNAIGMAEARATQATIANNLANAETAGFKRLLTVHAERSPAHATGVMAGMTGGNIMLPTRLDATQGPLEQTSNPLDLALVGDAFLAVVDRDNPAAPPMLSRDGRIAIDPDGAVVLANDPGRQVLGRNGQPMRVPAEVGRDGLAFNSAGDLQDSASPLGGTLGQLRLVRVDDPAGLIPRGGGLHEAAGPLLDAAPGEELVQPGFVERSNVEPTTELTRMIESGRLLEANANMIRHADSALGKLIEAARV